MSLEEEVLSMIRRGFNSRHRLVMALVGRDPKEIGETVARLIYRGDVKTENRKLVAA